MNLDDFKALADTPWPIAILFIGFYMLKKTGIANIVMRDGHGDRLAKLEDRIVALEQKAAVFDDRWNRGGEK